MSTELEYASFGISWKDETVSRQNGPNKTDRVAYATKAQIPVVADFAKFREHFTDAGTLALLNSSNSITVRAQAVNRALLEKGEKDATKLRLAVYNAMKGIRAQAQPVVVKVHALPNGELYNGSDLTEFRQLYAAALVDASVPPETATAIANMQNL